MWRGTSTDLGAGENNLVGLDDLFDETERPFGEADRFRIRLRGFRVSENRDWLFRGDNDLIVMTKFRFGNEPPVDRLHFLRKDVELGWQEDLLDDVVFSTEDLRQDRLWLGLQVYDVDKIDVRSRGSLSDVARRMAGATALTFPQLAPYASIAQLSTERLVSLVNHVDDHDEIIDDQVRLEPARPYTGHKLLQPGYFVCFAEKVDGHLELGQDLRVHRYESEYRDGSYAVFELDRAYNESKRRKLNEKAARLVSDLDNRGRSSEPPLHFLRETMDAYARFKKLKRKRELEEKRDRYKMEGKEPGQPKKPGSQDDERGPADEREQEHEDAIKRFNRRINQIENDPDLERFVP